MKEEDIRPRALFRRFLELAREDARACFATAPRRDVPCPACAAAGEPAFEKDGFAYALCPRCRTLYVSPRPDAAAFQAFYRDSPSARFWAEEFYPATAAGRRELVWKPKAAQVDALIARRVGQPCLVVDIGGGFGLFAEETLRLGRNRVLIIEPSRSLAEACRSRGLAVLEKFVENVSPGDLEPGPKCFVCFELFEHLHDPGAFLATLHRLMGPRDIFALTTLSGTGADILALWERSDAVSPPHHLNFLNPRAMATLLGRKGFTPLETSTPGRLDVSIMENNLDRIRDRFWSTALALADDAQKAAMQDFLREQGLSSHMFVVAGKSPDGAPAA